MPDSIFLFLQRIAPKLALTRFAGWVASSQWGGLTTRIIARFVHKYGVNMAEASQSDIKAYKSFNEFFTRELRAGVRPLADAAWVCPVDGAISQIGPIKTDQIYQAKGHQYSTIALVGGDVELAQKFEDGSFACLYLSPKDYHRIHMPCAGRLKRMIHVPGDLYSVNPVTARRIPGLFARNERVVCEFDTEHGPFVLVLVGATIVGSMATVWHGVVNPPRPETIREWTYDKKVVRLSQGEEMGRFLLGSTVVMLWPRQSIHFNSAWRAARAVRLGESMGQMGAGKHP
jgi:phosphatidylserine decarboxylase